MKWVFVVHDDEFEDHHHHSQVLNFLAPSFFFTIYTVINPCSSIVAATHVQSRGQTSLPQKQSRNLWTVVSVPRGGASFCAYDIFNRSNYKLIPKNIHLCQLNFLTLNYILENG
ncbi:hypothetical protein M9H77_28517 [Catharanthus roseus]|uniref:Uncharacterized protein n=1 Tax=Catharanthus roseus TaxID=4058 RepID=A0ACC0AFY3_CATRO|nr:hypothetical protein M9H77_28517 [Catharanthus roseus]